MRVRFFSRTECRVVLWLLIAISLASEVGVAGAITFGFSGHVTGINSSPGLVVGDPFSGSYTFDSEPSDADVPPDGLSRYRFPGPPYGMQVTVGDDTHRLADVIIGSRYIPGLQTYKAGTSGRNSGGQSIDIILDYPFGVMGNGLPLEPPPLFSSASFSPYFHCMVVSDSPDGHAHHFSGVLDALFVVPEPASLILLGTGIGVIGLAVLERKRM